MSFLVEHAHNKRIEELERQVAALKWCMKRVLGSRPAPGLMLPSLGSKRTMEAMQELWDDLELDNIEYPVGGFGRER